MYSVKNIFKNRKYLELKFVLNSQFSDCKSSEELVLNLTKSREESEPGKRKLFLFTWPFRGESCWLGKRLSFIIKCLKEFSFCHKLIFSNSYIFSTRSVNLFYFKLKLKRYRIRKSEFVAVNFIYRFLRIQEKRIMSLTHENLEVPMWIWCISHMSRNSYFWSYNIFLDRFC